MPIIIHENKKVGNKKRDKVGGGGMDIGKTPKTPKNKKPVKKMLGGANKMKPVKASKGKMNAGLKAFLAKKKKKK